MGIVTRTATDRRQRTFDTAAGSGLNCRRSMITGARSETMEQEEAKRPVRVSRQELYRQVWETPMMRLGKQYGISGNGLKKICNRLKIPYPSPGYWAKLQFGKRVKVTPLPESDVRTRQEVTVTPTP